MTERLAVLDASALVAWYTKEPGYKTVDKVLPYGVVPAPTMTETLYRVQDIGHRLSIPDLQESLLDLGVQIEPFLPEDAVRAADLIHQSHQAPAAHKIGTLSLGDAVCIAVAERLNLKIVGGDQLWETLELAVTYHPFR